jgi:cullin-4
LTRDPGPTDILPATYEAIYTACQAIVTVSQQGEDLYNIVRVELEKSITQLSRALFLSTEKDITWIATFNKALVWLEQQIVRHLSYPNAQAFNFPSGAFEIPFDIPGPCLCRARTEHDECPVSDFTTRNKTNLYIHFSDLAYFLVSEHIFGSARIAENLRVGVKSWLDWERTTGSVESCCREA